MSRIGNFEKWENIADISTVERRRRKILQYIMNNQFGRKQSLNEEPNQKILVGVAGGSAAGKTTLCENILRQMAFDRNFKVEIISLDSFYKNVDKTQVDIREYNFDHPNALDFDLAYKTLVNLMESSEPVPVPQYSFIEHARMKDPVYVGPANIIFFEGLMSFYDKRIRDLLTYKIFINCDDDIRLCRRLKRDTTERGRSVISVLEQYNKFVKNAFRDFILPTLVYADIIIPGFRNNRVSVDFIVQHIKNMARRITFKERAVKTKTFIFGESEIYDLQCLNSYDVKVTVQQQSFLVFPTQNQHKKELQFFLTSLLSEIFTKDYFHEIYIHQFLKILKTLLTQLMVLKNFKNNEMEIFSIYNIQEILRDKCSKYPIKVIFFPVAEKEFAKDILSQIKNYIQQNSQVTFILLNAFCDLNVPQMIYRLKLSNVIMINLFVIANDRRFRQIMSNNISVTTDNFDWFTHNHDIANEGVNLIAKAFNFYKTPEEQIAKACYNRQLTQQKAEDKPVKKEVEQVKEKVGIIQQYNVYSQQHGNLCGYHALSTIMCLEKGISIKDKDKYLFIANYHLMATSIGKVNFLPLERYNLSALLDSQLFHHHKNIGVLLFSFKYIQNTQTQNDDLQKLFNELNSGHKAYIYVVLGVHSHYVLTKITKQSISYYDSLNNSLLDVWNGTEDSLTESEKTSKDYKDTKLHMHNLKEALEILLDLLNEKKTVQSIMIEKIIQDVTDSFEAIKNSEEGISNWLANEYPPVVLQSQLIKVLRERKIELSEKHKQRFHDWFNHPKIHQHFQDKEKLLII